MSWEEEGRKRGKERNLETRIDSSNWKDGVAIRRNGEDCKKSKFEVKIKSSV